MDRRTHIVAKLERGRELYESLCSEITAFLASQPYSTYIERNGEWTILRLHVREDPPARWGAVVGDIVHNLRSSLDVAVYQLVEIGNGRATKKTAFPMTESLEDYTGNADRRTAGIGTAARRVIDAAKPYPGGNDDLYLLHELDVEDKHHLLLALAAGADQGLSLGPPVGSIQQIQLFNRVMSKHLFPLQEGSMLIKTNAASDPPEDILSLFNFFPFIAMRPEKWEAHEEVSLVLSRLAKATHQVIDGLLPCLDEPVAQ